MTDPLVLVGKVTVLLALALLTEHLLRRQAAALTHAMWTPTFVVLLVLPFADIVLPSLALPVLPSVEAGPQNHTGPGSVTLPTAASGGEVSLAPEAPPLAEPRHNAAVAAPAATPPGAPTPTWSPAVVVVAVWGTGAATSTLAILVAFVRVRRLTKGAASFENAEWVSALDRIAGRLGIKRNIRMLTSRQVWVPMTTGLWRPIVLVPEGAQAWEPQRRDIVLAHELSHVAAFDPLRLLIGRAASAIYWFHPLIWLAARRSRGACERASDESVVGLGVRRAIYASELLALARQGGSLAGPATVPMAQRSGLEDRLTHILTTNVRPPSRHTPRLLGLATALIAMTFAAMEPTSAALRERPARATDILLAGPALVMDSPAATGAPSSTVATAPDEQGHAPTAQVAEPTSLRVRAIDGVTGEGLRDVSLSMRCIGTTMYGRDLVTNDRGEVAIDDLGEDRCLPIVAVREGYTRDLSEMRYLEASDVVHVVHFWPRGNISGRALDPSGAPAVGVPVDILVQLDGSAPGWVNAGPTASTDQDGRFEFPARQTQRRYRLVARGLGASVDVDLAPGQSQGDIELRGGTRPVFRVAGRIIQDGASSRPLSVRLVSEERGIAIGPIATDPTGAFAFEDVPTGTYDVHAQPSGSLSPQFAVPVFSARVVVGDHVDDIVVAAVRVTTLRGVLEYDGDPSGGRVLLGLDRLDAPAGSPSSRMLQVAGTAFTIDGLVPGTYAFRATGVPTGYAVTRVAANGRDVTAEGFDLATVTGPVVVTLSNRLATIEGRVLTSGGNEASSAAVVVLAADPTARVVRIVQATQRGRFAVANLPPGEYAIAAVRSEELPAGLAFSLPSAADPTLAARVLPHAVQVTLAANETTTMDMGEVAVGRR